MAVTVRSFAGEVKLINLSYHKRCNNFIGTDSVNSTQAYFLSFLTRIYDTNYISILGIS